MIAQKYETPQPWKGVAQSSSRSNQAAVAAKAKAEAQANADYGSLDGQTRCAP